MLVWSTGRPYCQLGRLAGWLAGWLLAQSWLTAGCWLSLPLPLFMRRQRLRCGHHHSRRALHRGERRQEVPAAGPCAWWGSAADWAGVGGSFISGANAIIRSQDHLISLLLINTVHVLLFLGQFINCIGRMSASAVCLWKCHREQWHSCVRIRCSVSSHRTRTRWHCWRSTRSW